MDPLQKIFPHIIEKYIEPEIAKRKKDKKLVNNFKLNAFQVIFSLD